MPKARSRAAVSQTSCTSAAASTAQQAADWLYAHQRQAHGAAWADHLMSIIARMELI